MSGLPGTGCVSGHHAGSRPRVRRRPSRVRAGLGEITLVVAGAIPADTPPAVGPALAAQVAAAVADGTTRKEAIAAVAVRHGIPKRAVYDAVARHR